MMLGTQADQITRAIDAGAEHLFGRQRGDGAFLDSPPGSVLGTAGAIVALRAADPAGHAGLVAGGARWLRRTQCADGGWGGVEGAGSEVTATAVATAALALVDPAGSDAQIEAGQRRYAELGGLSAITDPAIAHICRQFAALAGFPDPGPALRLPLAVVLFDKVRQRRISFRTAPFIGLALLQDATEPAHGLRGRASRLARPKAMRLLAAIDAHEGHTGVFSFDPWPAALLCLGLAHAREAPGLVLAITGFLRRAVRPDGAWDAVANLDLTRSAFATSGLVAAGYAADPRLAATRDLFHRTQQRDPFPVFGVPAGGWSFSDAHGWPVTLESAEILHGLAGFPGAADDPALRSGIEWLTGRQDRAGSWSLWVRDTKLANDGPCPAITSQGVIALRSTGLAADSAPVAAAVRWLLSQQRPDGSYENLWYRDHTVGTAIVCDGLTAAGQADHPAAQAARRWLRGAQQPDGSWADGCTGPGTVEETAWALHALLTGPAAVRDSGALARGLQWLLDAQRPDGSWPAGRVCVYIRHLMHYPNGAITQGLALRALAAARPAPAGAGQ
jgi:squalene-hopene/tetraprenyl-beta-curcumene cyclase